MVALPADLRRAVVGRPSRGAPTSCATAMSSSQDDRLRCPSQLEMAPTSTGAFFFCVKQTTRRAKSFSVDICLILKLVMQSDHPGAQHRVVTGFSPARATLKEHRQFSI